MSVSRSRQAQVLAGLLTARTHTKVRLDYHDSLSARGRAWHVHWTDGPTWQQMLCVAAGVADRVPAFDLTQVRASRAHTERGEAVSLLLWLDSDPEHADKSPIVWPEFARDAISYPDRAGSVWQQRGEALLSLSASGSVDMTVCNALDARMGQADWAAVLAWLDGLTTGERRLSVVR